jgi:hypothetical protein
LFHVQRKLGHLNVPYWICSEKKRKRIIEDYTFDDAQGNPIGPDMYQHRLFLLVIEAQKRITTRTGYEFTGYDRPVWTDW